MNDPTKVKRAANVLREWLASRHPQSKGMAIALRNLDDETLIQKSRQANSQADFLSKPGFRFHGYRLYKPAWVAFCFLK